MNRLHFALAIVFAVVIVLTSSLPSVSALSENRLSAFGTATVDGVISAGEYGSSIGPITLQTFTGNYTFTIYETNDLQNDYYAFTINDTTYNPEDRFTTYFDNQHDGFIPQFTDPNLDIYEDAISVTGDGTFSDRHYGYISGSFNAPADSIMNGFAAATFIPGQGYVFEMSHPLNSGDPWDYNLSIGSTVGWCFIYTDMDTVKSIIYPVGAVSNPSLFGDVAKAGPPVGGVIAPVNTLAVMTSWIVVAIAAIAISIAILSRRKLFLH
jgi:hypothetical protein